MKFMILQGEANARNALVAAAVNLRVMGRALDSRSPAHLAAVQALKTATMETWTDSIIDTAWKLADAWYQARLVLGFGAEIPRISCRGVGCSGCCVNAVQASPDEAREIAAQLVMMLLAIRNGERAESQAMSREEGKEMAQRIAETLAKRDALR